MTVKLPGLETHATRVGGASAIEVAGELDMETAPRFAEEVELAVWGSVGAFVLDLSEVSFLDSAGLHALLRSRAYLAREDRPLVLVCPPGPVRRVLDLSGVLDTFIAYRSRDTAAAALVPAGDYPRPARPAGAPGRRGSRLRRCPPSSTPSATSRGTSRRCSGARC